MGECTNSSGSGQTVCVIGGGVSGIVTLRTLLAEGFDVTLLEARSRVGGVWSTGYVGQGAQSPSWFYEFSEFPVGDRYPLFMKKEDLCDYIDDYVSHFKLGPHIRCNVVVKDLENLEGKAWRVITEDGHQRVFDKVVICTGLFRKKHIPNFPGMDQTKVKVFHSSDCSDRSAFTGKDVVFVGYGKSTLDLMNELKDEVKSTTFLFREKLWPVPLALCRISIAQVVFCRAFRWVIPPYYTEATPWSILRRTLSALWWWLWEHILDWQHGLSAAGMRPELPCMLNMFRNQFVVPEGTYSRIASGDIKARQATITSFTKSGILLNTGEEISCDVVVFGTGFEAAMEILPSECKEKLICDRGEGPWLYRHIVHPDFMHLAFVGWASTNIAISTSTLQALWLAAFWRGGIHPTKKDMTDDIMKYRLWAATHVPPMPRRPCAVRFYVLPYHDQLIEDLGESKYLHGGILEDFQCYYPPTYRPLTVCVIGGGVSGIVTLRTLLAEGFDVTLFEARSRVGGVWSTGYVGQGAQSPSWFYEFSEFPVGDRYPLFMKKEDLCSYIDDYVSHFKLGPHIHCNVLVKDLENLDGKAWRVTTQDGQQRVFDKVVICTGLFRKKHIPDFPGMDQTKVKVFHSSDCSDRSAFTGKDVVFVGYGKSTLDLMNELKDEVKSTTFVYREKRWPLPGNLWKISIIHVSFCRAFEWLLPSYYTEDRPRSSLYKFFTAVWWWLWEHILDWQHGLSAAGMRPGSPFVEDIFHNQFVVPEGTYERIATGDMSKTRFVKGGVSLLEGPITSPDLDAA
ncbi:monooxygenase, partial [Perkinsus olseni]